MWLKKHAVLIAGLFMPVIMIALIAASIYGPALFVKPPQFDFVYTTGDVQYGGGPLYDVMGGLVVRNERATTTEAAGFYYGTPKLMRYDMREQKAVEITYEEAYQLRLDTAERAPDGYRIVQGNNGGSFPIFDSSSNYGTRYVESEGRSMRLNLPESNPSYGYRGEFRFLGWIIP